MAEGRRRVGEAAIVEGGGPTIGASLEGPGATLSLAVNPPRTWQARMRSSITAGMLLASLSAKACSTSLTMVGNSGRGSSSQIVHFIAKAWLRSWITLAPSP